ncbi:MAG: hypothetical protein WAW80_05445 [Candidatus Saccharimonadales bacterium]
MKSLQLSLNELIPKLGLPALSVTNMAYSKARRKLKHTAFIALNQLAVVDVMYADQDYHTLYGFRILAVDGSKVQLPTNEATARDIRFTPERCKFIQFKNRPHRPIVNLVAIYNEA